MMKRALVWCAIAVALAITSNSAALAGVTVSTYADGPWGGTPVLVTTATPQATMTVNQQHSAGTSYTQTFRTGPEGFRLDMIDIYSGGKAGGTARLNIYAEPLFGGENGDGFVNTSFSTDLLNGGAGLEFTFNGSPGPQYLRLDLTGDDQIVLAPNQQYAVELDILTGQFSWLRSGAAGYADGNIYRDGTESGFNGTPPANNRGTRTQVGGVPDRDGGMALYGIPEPASFVLAAFGLLFVGLSRRRPS